MKGGIALYIAIAVITVVAVAVIIAIKRKQNRIWAEMKTPVLEKIGEFNCAIKTVPTEYITFSDEQSFLENWKSLYNEAKKLTIPKKDGATNIFNQFFHDYENFHEINAARNLSFVNEEKKRYDSIFSNIDGKSLDDQQRTVVVTNENNTLVLAGAGSGKTLTIAGKVKYLCECKKVNPSDILLIAFTKKSADEMTERIRGKLGIPILSTTFHKLGLDIIKGASETSIDIYEDISAFVNDYFENKISDNPDAIKSLIQYFAYYLCVPANMDDFSSLGEAFEYERAADLKTLKSKYKESSIISQQVKTKKAEKRTLKSEHVKSLEEVTIANFLFLNGIEYEYERPYPFESEDSRYKKYHPDFYLPEYDIYIEHFGINKEGKLPWLSQIEEQKYIEGMQWKREFHKQHGTVLLETYSYYSSDGSLLSNLEIMLKEHHVKFVEPDFTDIFNTIYGSKSEKYFSEFNKLCCTFIALFKSHNYKIEDLSNLDYSDKKSDSLFHIQRKNLFVSIMQSLLQSYDEFLTSIGAVDFSDMINKATDIVSSGYKVPEYKYVIIDEYQDISVARYKLVKAIIDQTNAKLLCVGDDWQSIYRFTGSDISLFTNFSKYFGYSAILKIEKTYRNSQQLIDEVGNFITKNPQQIEKSLRSDKKLDYPITFAFFETSPFEELKKVINKIISEFGNDKSILLLGRTNYDFEFIKESGLFIIDKKGIRYTASPETPISFLTVHKAKGLEADNVVLLNFRNDTLGFPNKISNDPILELVLNEFDPIMYAEERRLLYVALTRTKNRVFIITQKSAPSEFLHDFNPSKNVFFWDNVNGKTESNISCPHCKTGKLLIKLNDSQNKYFVGCSNYPNCTYTVNDTSIIDEPRICSECGGFMVKKKGPYGYFYGCTNYPYCAHKEKM